MNTPQKDAQNCLRELRQKLPASTLISVGQGSEGEVDQYYRNALIFNRRLNENPFIIVYCESAEDVKNTYLSAIDNNIPVRVRAGGHDHEGECSGTNTVLIDVSKMNTVHVDRETGIAKIGPGNRFVKLTTDLANEDVMIAHGTCATVGISGFTLGGGWGPWTRKFGMNCERLMGATIMLGNGEIIDVDYDEVNNEVPDLLWALRGGGGMSYGIVTEFRIKTFALPSELIKFELEWNPYEGIFEKKTTEEFNTLDILKAWEAIIESDDTSVLIGTNLKINGRPSVENFDYENISHNAVMYGYWEGNEADLRDFIALAFKGLEPEITIDGTGGTHADDGTKLAYGARLMSSWDRESYRKIQVKMNFQLDSGEPLPPDDDKPAPHKITSRLVDHCGLDDNGYEQLLLSLTSSLIFEENRALGLFTYVTLGAITGEFYQNKNNGTDSAFPYKDKQYTIQYQTWWNTQGEYAKSGQDSFVYDFINRAMDWISVSRDFDIPNTSGAFISFKDSSVPTKTYFGDSYERLKEVKIRHSKDPKNHLRTRKTIL